MDVPEIPLSYNFTGVMNSVMPKAFTIPAIVSMKRFVIQGVGFCFISSALLFRALF